MNDLYGSLDHLVRLCDADRPGDSCRFVHQIDGQRHGQVIALQVSVRRAEQGRGLDATDVDHDLQPQGRPHSRRKIIQNTGQLEQLPDSFGFRRQREVLRFAEIDAEVSVVRNPIPFAQTRMA